MEREIHTAEALLRAGDIGRCELVRGELLMMLPTGGRHAQVVMRIARVLAEFVERHGLGEMLTGEPGFVLARDPDTVRAPDVAFVRRGREIGDSFVEGAPQLAVEVLSPGDRSGYVREKVAEWLEAGAEAVWVVDPKARTVAVHAAGGDTALLSQDDELSGGPVLPGFALPLAELF
jgi:Uma2 family endonuclease